MELIEQDATEEPCGVVSTAGLGGAFPEDIAVGRVVSVRSRDFEMFQRAVIQPTVNFNALEIVLLVTNFRRLEIAP